MGVGVVKWCTLPAVQCNLWVDVGCEDEKD